MQIKLFKTHERASVKALADPVFVGTSGEPAFAHRADLFDAGDSTIIERSFAWRLNERRTLRVFRLPGGDTGFRAFGDGLGDDQRAQRVFDNQDEALAYLSTIAQAYSKGNKGWRAV